jgi:hypothetical protein
MLSRGFERIRRHSGVLEKFQIGTEKREADHQFVCNMRIAWCIRRSVACMHD